MGAQIEPAFAALGMTLQAVGLEDVVDAAGAFVFLRRNDGGDQERKDECNRGGANSHLVSALFIGAL